MNSETHENPNPPKHGDYERRDIGVRGIFYFIAGMAVAAVLIHLILAGLYEYLDKRERAHQPPVNPLVSNAPENRRRVPSKYPDVAFPEPRLENDETNQLDGIRIGEEQKLNSYDWVDQKTGTVRIPIERAMDLLVQHGLPLRPQEGGRQMAAAGQAMRQKAKQTKENK